MLEGSRGMRATSMMQRHNDGCLQGHELNNLSIAQQLASFTVYLGSVNVAALLNCWQPHVQ